MWPFKQGKEQVPERTCRQCHYFNEYVFPERVQPDKKVIHGGVVRWECSRGKFDLNELAPCSLFEYEPNWQRRIPFPTLHIPLPVANSGSLTPEPIKEWVRQQTDLSPAERNELAADLEGYFRKRQARIQSEKLGGE